MPRVSVRRVRRIDPEYEARLIAAKTDWEQGRFPSKRAAADAYNVS